MRVMSISVLLLGLSTTPVFGQSADPALHKAVESRDAARIAGDEQTWGRYTTDDFILTDVNGEIRTKAQRMAAIKGNKQTNPPAKASEERFRAYGDTVIRTLRNGAQRLTEVWVKQAGEWRVAGTQVTPIAKP